MAPGATAPREVLVVDPALLEPPVVVAPAPPAPVAAVAVELLPIKPEVEKPVETPKKPVEAAKPVEAVKPVEATKPVEVIKPVVVAKAAEPALDVDALKERVRSTGAIGVMTKLALKNQMDDLIGKFRAHYQLGHKTGDLALRPPYDALIVRMVGVLEEGDPALARTISGSREAIWGILMDPQKFAAAS